MRSVIFLLTLVAAAAIAGAVYVVLEPALAQSSAQSPACPTPPERGVALPIAFRDLPMDQKYRVEEVLNGRLARFAVLTPHGDAAILLVDDYYPPELKAGWLCNGQLCSAPSQ